MSKKILCVIVLFTLISSCNKEDKQSIHEKKPEAKYLFNKDSFLEERIDTFFERRFNEGRFNGVVLYADHGQIVFNKAFGYSNFNSKEKLTTNSIFQLASVSKQFTAAAIMLLKQQGKLSYSDSVRKFFPLFPYYNITIKQLLIHSSGLPNYMYFVDEYWPDKNIPINNMAVLNLMTIHKPKEYFQPGSKFNYSNTGYCILASIVERVTGMTFQKFMEKNFFVPLGMNSTFVMNGEKKFKDRIAIGYYRPGRQVEEYFQNGVVGDKGVYSTAEDLLKWDQELYNATILIKSIIDEAFIPEYEFKRNRDYGFGWRIIMNNGKKIAYHGGWWKGYRAYFIRSLEDRKTIIVLINVATHIAFNVKGLLGLFNPIDVNNKKLEMLIPSDQMDSTTDL